MMKGPRGRQPLQKGDLKAQAGNIKRVLAYAFRFYKWQFLLVMVCILVSSLSSLQSTLFLQTLIDDHILPMLSGGGDGFPALLQALLRLALIMVAGVIAAYTQQRVMVTVGQGTLLHIRQDLFTAMQKLPLRYFDTHQHGDIMSVYTNDVDTLRQLISQTIPNLVESLATLIITFISMIRLSIPLTGLTVVMVILITIISGKIAGSAGRYFGAQQANLGKVNGFVEEMVSGQKVVKVFCHEDKAIEQFDALNNELRQAADTANRYAGVMGPVNNNLGHITYVVSAVLGAVLVLKGTAFLGPALTLGALVTFLQLSKNFIRPISQVTQQLSAIIMAMAGAVRIFAMMDEEPEADNGVVTLVNAVENPDGSITETDRHTGLWAWKYPRNDGSVTYTRLEGGVTFDNVDFGYTDEKIVLHGITLYAKPGQKIAFVGGTGAGKTTITNLINRFYDVQDGKIRYDGINVNRIAKGDLRRSLGVVLQDTHLFTGTVMDNIRYGRLDATDEECIAAAKVANAHGFIKRLPDGYQTVLTNDGANLSQGQRQLLSIARAAVADPPALILDEATSSIDTRTEALVQQGMDALMKGRTTFVIAHRLSTVRNADCIMVLEQGRIIERGTHDDLLAQKGKYYQLYTGNAIGG